MTSQEVISQAYNDPQDFTAWMLNPREVAAEVEIINQAEESDTHVSYPYIN